MFENESIKHYGNIYDSSTEKDPQINEDVHHVLNSENKDPNQIQPTDKMSNCSTSGDIVTLYTYLNSLKHKNHTVAFQKVSYILDK